jgi:DNA polymerase-3 subunit gamma/tau
MLEGRSVDIIEIDGASNNSVEDVRKLRDNAKYAPVVGKYKMYIIDEVHMLSTSAFNALLKTLEDPPAHLIFVFATTEIHKVPATILSRCQRFDFRRMEIETITNHLRHITSKEGISIDESSLVSIAKKADGSMRDSQSILDQVVSFCGTTITSAEVSNALHLIDTDFYFQLSDAITAHDIPTMFTHARTVVQRGYDLQECLLGLLEHFRNMLTVITTGGTDLIDASGTDLERYRTAAATYTKADVLRIMTLITQGEAVLRQNPPQPRIRFEFTLVQLAAMDSTVDLGNVLAMLNAPAIPATVPPHASTQVVGGVAMAQPIPVRLGTPVIMKTQEKPVSSLSSGNLAKRWSQWIESLPEHLSFVQTAVKQNVLAVDMTDVGIILRPQAEIVYHRLEDKLQQLKEYLLATYGTAIGVHLVRPRQNIAAQAPSQASSEQTGTQQTEVALAGAARAEDIIPLEQTLIDLFSARRASAPRK